MKTIEPSAGFLRGAVGATSTPSMTAGLAAVFATDFFSDVTSTASFFDVALDFAFVVFTVDLMSSCDLRMNVLFLRILVEIRSLIMKGQYLEFNGQIDFPHFNLFGYVEYDGCEIQDAH